MRYRIKGEEIRSENAAKPLSAAAAHLVHWLQNREYTHSALDFGCGKLRYTSYLAQQSEQLGIVDSAVQISRPQLIDGKERSVREYVEKKWPSCRIHLLERFWQNPSHRYDFVLCANVLSAVPSARARARSLRAIHAALSKNGHVLFVNQHTNSYFKEIRKRASTQLHLDGWIAHSRGGASYYGVLSQDTVSKLIVRYKLTVEEAWIEGQSNYVLASREES